MDGGRVWGVTVVVVCCVGGGRVWEDENRALGYIAWYWGAPKGWPCAGGRLCWGC